MFYYISIHLTTSGTTVDWGLYFSRIYLLLLRLFTAKAWYFLQFFSNMIKKYSTTCWKLCSGGQPLRLVRVAPSVSTAAVLPPAVSAADAAFRTSARESWVIRPVTLSIVESGSLGTVPRGLVVPPRVLAASPACVHAATGAVAAPRSPAAATPFLPAFASGSSDRDSVILGALFPPLFFSQACCLDGGSTQPPLSSRWPRGFTAATSWRIIFQKYLTVFYIKGDLVRLYRSHLFK